MTQQPTAANVTLSGPSLTQFTMAYALCLAMILAITTVLRFEVPSSMGIISLMAAMSWPVQTYVMKTGQALTNGQRARFALWGTLISIALSLAITGAVMYALSGTAQFDAFLSEIKSMWAELPALVVALPFITLGVSWLVLYFGSGFMGRMAVKQMKKASA